MSFPTQPAFVYTGGWSEELRSHPAMKFLEEYTVGTIDTRSFNDPKSSGKTHHTDDMVFIRSDGSSVSGAEESWKAIAQVYAPFAAHKHQPEQITVWETSYGWDAMGWANVYFNLHGPVSEEGETDKAGEKWNGVGTGAFYFKFVKEGGDGIKLKGIQQFVDTTPAIRLMLKNQHINGDQLAGLVKGA